MNNADPNQKPVVNSGELRTFNAGGQIPSGIKKKSTNRGIDQVIVLKM
jgi:hypothetical protein